MSTFQIDIWNQIDPYFYCILFFICCPSWLVVLLIRFNLIKILLFWNGNLKSSGSDGPSWPIAATVLCRTNILLLSSWCLRGKRLWWSGKFILVKRNSSLKRKFPKQFPGTYCIYSYSSPKIVFMKSYCFDKSYVDLTCWRPWWLWVVGGIVG